MIYMALDIRKSITLDGNSVIDGTIAETYRATINDANPEDMTIDRYQQNKIAYKANRVQCRKDAVEFEELAYAMQDEMIKAKTETATNEATTDETFVE